MAKPEFGGVGGYAGTGLGGISNGEKTALKRELAKLKAVYARDAKTNRTKTPDFDMMHPRIAALLDREIDDTIFQCGLN